MFAAALFRFFASMTQALVGAMTGAGLAPGQTTVRWGTVRNDVTGWLGAVTLAFLVLACMGIGG